MRPLLNALAANHRIATYFVAIILYGYVCTSTHPVCAGGSDYVAKWDFGAEEDAKRDQWPDGWTRTSNQFHPKFIPIRISRQTTDEAELQEIEQFRRLASQLKLAFDQRKWPWQVIPETVPKSLDQLLEKTVLNPYLLVNMDGGAAEVLSPIVKIDDHSVYFMSCLIRSNATDFTGEAKLRFLDESQTPLFEVATRKVSGKRNGNEQTWQTVNTDSKYPYREGVRYAQVVLQVSPKSAKAYRGDFGFDSIRIYRTPRLNLFVDQPSKMYREGERVVVRCTATGMNKEQSSLTLKLVDHNGNKIAEKIQDFKSPELEGRLIASGDASRINSPAPVYWDGVCEWEFPDLESGYYELTTQLARGTTGVFQLSEQFAVLPKDGLGKPDIRFGWTMSSVAKAGTHPIELNRLIDLLRESRVGKVKLPIWFDSQDPKSMREYTERIDRVQTAGIGCVGVIAVPPQSLRDKFPRMNSDDTGVAMEDSVMVQSFLEPVLRQMCVRIVDFQIGWDHETDFVGNPRFSSSLESIKRLTRRYGQEAQLLASHSPGVATPQATGIDRWQIYSGEELTSDEMQSLIQRREATEHGAKTPWMSITPLDPAKYSLPVRVQDMVARMLSTATEMGGLGTTSWISDPTSDEVGMIAAEGGPREMFVPFRSIAGVLAGSRNLGKLPISAIPHNYLVTSGDRASIIAWSSAATKAQLYLGDNAKARDVWGRDVEIETLQTDHGPEQRFFVDKWPIIIDGVDLNVARWRTGIKLAETRLDPLVGQTQVLRVKFANPLGVPAIGRIQVDAPSIFADSTSVSFEIDANAEGVIEIPVQVRPDANTSSTAILLQFMITGDNPILFAVEEEIQIGSGDVEFEAQYQIDDQNRLWINIEAINHTAIPLSFDCMLHIPGRPYERCQIAGLRDRESRSIVLNDATSLIGERLWLRCMQIGSQRILNYRIEIKP